MLRFGSGRKEDTSSRGGLHGLSGGPRLLGASRPPRDDACSPPSLSLSLYFLASDHDHRVEIPPNVGLYV